MSGQESLESLLTTLKEQVDASELWKEKGKGPSFHELAAQQAKAKAEAEAKAGEAGGAEEGAKV